MRSPTPEEAAKAIVGILENRSADAGHLDLIADVKSSFLVGADEKAFAEGVEFGVKKGWFCLTGVAIQLTPGRSSETK